MGRTDGLAAPAGAASLALTCPPTRATFAWASESCFRLRPRKRKLTSGCRCAELGWPKPGRGLSGLVRCGQVRHSSAPATLLSLAPYSNPRAQSAFTSHNGEHERDRDAIEQTEVRFELTSWPEGSCADSELGGTTAVPGRQQLRRAALSQTVRAFTPLWSARQQMPQTKHEPKAVLQ